MNTDDFYSDKYEHYEELFDPLRTDRQARRKRKPRVNHQPKKPDDQVIAEIAETVGLEGGFNTTYQPARYETDWLLGSLRSFYNYFFCYQDFHGYEYPSAFFRSYYQRSCLDSFSHMRYN